MKPELEPAFAGFGAALEELIALIESGTLSSVSICVRLPDATIHEIPIGESNEERAGILTRLHARMRACLH